MMIFFVFFCLLCFFLNLFFVSRFFFLIIHFLFSLTLSCSGFSSSISLRRSWSAVLSSWLICSVVWVSASSSWLSFSSFCFCSLSFMRSSSPSRNSLRRLNSAVTSSSRSPARSCEQREERERGGGYVMFQPQAEVITLLCVWWCSSGVCSFFCQSDVCHWNQYWLYHLH